MVLDSLWALAYQPHLPRPLPGSCFSPWLQDKIWEWPGDEAITHHTQAVVLQDFAELDFHIWKLITLTKAG